MDEDINYDLYVYPARIRLLIDYIHSIEQYYYNLRKKERDIKKLSFVSLSTYEIFFIDKKEDDDFYNENKLYCNSLTARLQLTNEFKKGYAYGSLLRSVLDFLTLEYKINYDQNYYLIATKYLIFNYIVENIQHFI